MQNRIQLTIQIKVIRLQLEFFFSISDQTFSTFEPANPADTSGPSFFSKCKQSLTGPLNYLFTQLKRNVLSYVRANMRTYLQTHFSILFYIYFHIYILAYLQNDLLTAVVIYIIVYSLTHLLTALVMKLLPNLCNYFLTLASTFLYTRVSFFLFAYINLMAYCGNYVLIYELAHYLYSLKGLVPFVCKQLFQHILLQLLTQYVTYTLNPFT